MSFKCSKFIPSFNHHPFCEVDFNIGLKNKRRKSNALSFPAACALLAAGILTGCSPNEQGAGEKTAAGNTPASDAAPAPPKPQPVKVDLALHKPNEMGQVPVLEYHHIEPKEERWTRTPANFRKDLETLHKLGYQPVSLMEYVNGTMDLPPGKSPVVFTFDDSDPGQFRYLGTGPNAKLDPNCAVAIMRDFAQKHPDFPAKATFYVLPSLFEQPEFKERKLRELQEWGFEIGNHSYSHPALRKLSRAEGMKELAKGVKVTTDILPGYKVQSIALPFGSIPKDESILRGGAAEGVTYRHEAAMLVGANPAPSPYSKNFKPFRIPRIQATDTVEPKMSFWIKQLERNKYRSDGDPNTITILKKHSDDLNRNAVKGKTVKEY